MSERHGEQPQIEMLQWNFQTLRERENIKYLENDTLPSKQYHIQSLTCTTETRMK